MNKVTPFLWFADNAEAALAFYLSVFTGSAVSDIRRYPAGGPMPGGTFMSGTFSYNGLSFVAFNGGPALRLNPSFSLMVHCDTQEEVDYYWGRLSAGGHEDRCGWLTDQFGVSWQVVPGILDELLQHTDAVKAGKVMQALMEMRKLDIAALKAAAE